MPFGNADTQTELAARNRRARFPASQCRGTLRIAPAPNPLALQCTALAALVWRPHSYGSGSDVRLVRSDLGLA